MLMIEFDLTLGKWKMASSLHFINNVVLRSVCERCERERDPAKDWNKVERAKEIGKFNL